MKTSARLLIVAALIAAVGIAIALKQYKSNEPAGDSSRAAATESNAVPAVTTKLPRLVDLGATKCVPCKMMAPILEELKKEYAGRMNVEFIDVWQNPDAGKQYGIEIIPTQIFFDAEGKELFRHVGFFSKQEILSKWKEFGVDLTNSK